MGSNISTNTSSFNANEETLLRINITNNSNIILPTLVCTVKSYDIINTFQYDKYDKLWFKEKWIEENHNFMKKNIALEFGHALHYVLYNENKNQKQFEGYTYDLADIVMKSIGFNKPYDCNLRSHSEKYVHIINNKVIEGIPDKVYTNVKNLNTCVVREDKHRNTKSYKNGDIQLVSNIILAYENNYKMGEDPLKTKIYGVKFLSDDVYIYQVNITKDYLIDIINNRNLSTDINVYKLFIGSLSNPQQRPNIFHYLTSLRNIVNG